MQCAAAVSLLARRGPRLGGEGDMALWAHLNKKAHMICELSLCLHAER